MTTFESLNLSDSQTFDEIFPWLNISNSLVEMHNPTLLNVLQQESDKNIIHFLSELVQHSDLKNFARNYYSIVSNNQNVCEHIFFCCIQNNKYDIILDWMDHGLTCNIHMRYFCMIMNSNDDNTILITKNNFIGYDYY